MRLTRSGLAALLAVLAMGQGTAAAQTASHEAPPEGFVWYVLNTLNGADLDIEDPTNRPPLITEVPGGVLEPVEVNGDGRTDWLIRWPEAIAFCGTGGCRVSLYISDGDGFVRAFDRQALAFGISGVGAGRRVEATLHALECEDGSDPCRRAWVWDKQAGRLREHPPGAAPVAVIAVPAATDMEE